MNLEGKIIVVTGSSRGIGAAIAKRIARAGGIPIITYCSSHDQADIVAKATNSPLVLELDVTSRESINRSYRIISRKFGYIDGLVNNAGINRTGDFNCISDEDWNAVISVDLTGVFLVCQEYLPLLRNGGRIVNIGSLSGEYGGPRTPSYAAAKAGVMALTHNLARFLAHRDITVNCVSPGIIESELTAATMPPDLKAAILPQILLGRLGSVEEVSGIVTFLLSNEASYITAQTISVNGGAWVR